MCSVAFAVCSDAGKIRHNGRRTPAKTIPAFSQTAKAGCSFDAPDDALCAAAQNETGYMRCFDAVALSLLHPVKGAA